MRNLRKTKLNRKRNKNKKKPNKNTTNKHIKMIIINKGVYSLGFLTFFLFASPFMFKSFLSRITCAPIDDDGLWIYDIIS